MKKGLISLEVRPFLCRKQLQLLRRRRKAHFCSRLKKWKAAEIGSARQKHFAGHFLLFSELKNRTGLIKTADKLHHQIQMLLHSVGVMTVLQTQDLVPQ